LLGLLRDPLGDVIIRPHPIRLHRPC